jgi:heme/copper-type cytochrome/quinol oxidase subunit 3
MSAVPPRSMEATSAPEAAAVSARRQAQPNGWWAMACLVAAETALFGTLIASYFYLRFNNPRWPPPGIEAPSVALPIVLTGVLTLTAIPMLLAARAAQAGRRRTVMRLVALALIVQGGYLAVQIVEFLSDLSKFGPRDEVYGSIYFTMLAADHAHVAIGLFLNLWVLARLRTGLTNYRVVTVRVVSLYWYMVIVVTIEVVAKQLSPG